MEGNARITRLHRHARHPGTAERAIGALSRRPRQHMQHAAHRDAVLVGGHGGVHVELAERRGGLRAGATQVLHPHVHLQLLAAAGCTVLPIHVIVGRQAVARRHERQRRIVHLAGIASRHRNQHRAVGRADLVQTIAHPLIQHGRQQRAAHTRHRVRRHCLHGMGRGRCNRHLGLARHGRLQLMTSCPLHVRLQFGGIGIRTTSGLHHGRQRCGLGCLAREGGQLGRTALHGLGRRRAHAGIGTITAAAARQQRQQRCPHRELIALAHLFSFYPVEKELQKHVVASCSPQPWRADTADEGRNLNQPDTGGQLRGDERRLPPSPFGLHAEAAATTVS